MTIRQLFDYVDELKPNAFSNATKTVWLNEVEGMVQTEIFLLSEKECFEYVWEEIIPATITIPEQDDVNNVIGIADPEIRHKFCKGGNILNFAPGEPYTADAKTEVVVRDITPDGLLVNTTFSVTGDTPVETNLQYYGGNYELLVEPPHNKIYAQYIAARIDYANGEYDRYANSMAMFNEFWGEFSRWFARRYRPADRKGGTRNVL